MEQARAWTRRAATRVSACPAGQAASAVRTWTSACLSLASTAVGAWIPSTATGASARALVSRVIAARRTWTTASTTAVSTARLVWMALGSTSATVQVSPDFLLSLILSLSSYLSRFPLSLFASLSLSVSVSLSLSARLSVSVSLSLPLIPPPPHQHCLSACPSVSLSLSACLSVRQSLSPPPPHLSFSGKTKQAIITDDIDFC